MPLISISSDAFDRVRDTLGAAFLVGHYTDQRFVSEAYDLMRTHEKSLVEYISYLEDLAGNVERDVHVRY